MESNISTSWLTVDSASGGSFDAYVCLPPSGFGPGVLILQEIYGVNEHIKTVCEQYALDGFVAVSPDVFWRQEKMVDLPYDENGTSKGLELFSNLNINLVASDLQRTVEAIRHIPSCSGKVGSVGFCMGGLLSFVSAARAGVETAVCYYGTKIDEHLSWVEDITCPILFHFAENDEYIKKNVISKIATKFKNKQTRIIIHNNSSHGFNCWRRSSWNQPVAITARGQTLVHLMESLS